MNKRMVFYTVGKILKLESFLLILPLICSIIYREKAAFSFLITMALALAIGFLFSGFKKPNDQTIYAKEGFVIVALAWIAMSVIGTLPFYLSREIPSFIDAFFETVSGFTTTGASILVDVEKMSKGLLFWRSFTHWIGGMGVLVLVMAIVPADNGRSMHIMRAEMPGPIIGKLVPRAKSTAKILYLIYIVMTATEILLLICGDMPIFDSIVHGIGTAGTGGFGIKGDGLAGYSPYCQWVITIFMILFGINFNLYYLLLMRKPKTVLKSEELWFYISILVVATTVIALNINSIYGAESLRYSAFQVASIISTTGFSTADFNLWPTLSKSIILMLMLTGACAGSTAGGFKLSRVLLLFKKIISNLKHMLHPRSIESVRLEGKKVDDATLTNVSTYLALYCLCMVVIFLIIGVADPFDLETNISATFSCFNNIGPGFSKIGPLSNYSAYSDFSTVVLSFGMLLGRLEILPMILLFAPSSWMKLRKGKKI